MKSPVIILGSGIIGISSAIILLEHGYQVRLIAENFPPHTTSDKAGAIWFPYQVQPIEQATSWGQMAYERWERLSLNATSGVSMVEFKVIEAKDTKRTPWWCKAIPKGQYRTQTNHLPLGWEIAYIMTVPFIDPSKCLPFLIKYAKSLGLTMEKRVVHDFGLLLDQYSEQVIINCTGFGAKALTHDESLYPVQGQAMALEALPYAVYTKLDHSPNLPTYVFTREDEVIIGGSALLNQYEEIPSNTMTESIKERCFQVIPELASQKILREWVGLRPCRPSICLEWDNSFPIIHNYGHGGAGYTVSWGCANEVLRLLSAVNS